MKSRTDTEEGERMTEELREALAEAARAELACGTAWYIPTGESIADALLTVILADRERHAREWAAEELRRVASGVGAGAGIGGLPGAVKQALGIAAGVIYVRADELASEATS